MRVSKPWFTAGLAAFMLLGGVATASADMAKSHGLSVFGDLKYKPDFKHFDYVNPNAPKGGTLRLWGLDSFDNLNPFILKGVPPSGIDMTFASLMASAGDEPDAMYGLVAESVSVPPNRAWVTFHLRPQAKFHDGSSITSHDVVFTFNVLLAEGHPRYKIIYQGVHKVEALGPQRVRFVFKPGVHRDLPTRLAGLPVLSKAYYAKTAFNKTTIEPPLGSGPYRVKKVEPGRFVEYERVADHWAKDLPVNKGRHNFGAIRIDYYRDRDVALEAFFSGAYDFREEFTSRDWATKYTTPAVKKKLIVLDTLSDETPSGVQAWFFNLRRKKFRDRRVRRALNLAFDFEWTNKNLFYSLYKRTNSMFENSALAAHNPPDKAQLALLEPLRGKVPDEVFTKPYKAPVTDGSGRLRRNLRAASKLLREAGWRIKDNKRVNAKGEALTIEFLLFEASFSRIISPYIRNLKRLGVEATIRVVDVANFINRRNKYDFDVMIERYVQPLTPGVEQRDYFGSAAADVSGSRNLAGIKDPAVDSLIERVMGAGDRKALTAAVRALDRVLMWNEYSVTQWYKGSHNVAYWNKFDRPETKPRYALGMIDTWWYNPAKAAMIEKGEAPK